MVILALETATRAGSVAVRRDGRLLVGRTGDPTRTHGERLPGDLLAALGAAGLSLGDVDLCAVASGPGSFTGLRVGIATVQGLALSRQLPVVGIPTLKALARAGLAAQRGTGVRPSLVIPWMNAHRDEVFTAIYGVEANSRLVERRLATVGSAEAVIREWSREERDTNCLVVGDAVAGTGALLSANLTGSVLMADVPILAPAVAFLAEEAGISEARGPDAVQPVYIRRPDAELARDRQVSRS